MCTKIRLRPRTIIWYNDITGQNESSSYYIIKQGKLEVNIEISVLEMSEIWLLQVSLEDHARHHHLTWELIMDLQYSISIIIVLLTSYLWDLDIRRAVYVIGFELQCKYLWPLFYICSSLMLLSVEWTPSLRNIMKKTQQRSATTSIYLTSTP